MKIEGGGVECATAFLFRSANLSKTRLPAPPGIPCPAYLQFVNHVRTDYCRLSGQS